MGLSIQNNLSSLLAQNNLLKTQRAQQSAMQKLSSGFKINSGKDDPAGLVISEYLRSQLAGIQQSMQNSQEAYNTVSIAEGGLSEVSNMLTGMRSLALHALNSGVTSSEQVSADQAELNGMLNSISHITNTTRYASDNLLDGSNAINFTAQDADNILNTGATQIDLVADNVQDVSVNYSGDAADQAEKAYLESGTFAGGTLTEDVSFTVSGELGSQTFDFSAGTAITDVADAINNAAGSTGVNAYSIQGDTQIRLVSEEYGSEAFVQVQQAADSGDFFAAAGEQVRDEGKNATLNIKGVSVETQGLEADVANSAFSGKMVFNEGDTANTTIAQTGYDQDTLTDATTVRNATLGDISGGVRLQLTDGAGSQNREVLGMNSMALSNLGRVTVDGDSYSMQDLFSGGAASLANNPEAALAVIDQAIADVASERARYGAYQTNTLQTNINSLSVAYENIAATESNIRDTDMAAMITEYTKQKLLSDAGLLSVQSANQNATNVLKLLGA